MEIKQEYKKPETFWIEISSEGVIASSFKMTDEQLDGPARSKKNFWGED